MLETILFISNITFFPSIDLHPAIVHQIQRSQPKPVQIQAGKLTIAKKLQQEIARQIPKIEQQQQQNSKLLSIPYDRTIGLGYLHQGHNNWKIIISYGAYSIDSSDHTIYSTQEIFRLRQAFALTDRISIAGKTYNTDGSMQQVGPMLHNLSAGI